MRRILSGCCACATSGHAAAPPISEMNSRRLIVVARDAQETILAVEADGLKGPNCPLWVISGHSRRKKPCPLYPQ
jgi:hypothetical protein